MPYRIEYFSEAESHLQALKKRERQLVLEKVQRQLVHQPTQQTTNRKPMRSNPLTTTWELRIDKLRVYYTVEEEPERVVYIYAVGVKDRNQVRIGGRILDLGEEGAEG